MARAAIPLASEHMGPGSPYFKWLQEEAASYEEALRRYNIGSSWVDWLHVMAFDYLQRVQTMYEAALPEGTDVTTHMVEQIEEHLACPPAYPDDTTFDLAWSDRWDELERMPYDQFLQTREWRERREAVRRRFGYRCAICNSPDALQIHHRTYERRGSEKPTDLVCLCADCHRGFHERRGNGSRGLAR